jgi:phage I-like protein
VTALLRAVRNLRWAIATAIAPDLVPAVDEMRECLRIIYIWTTFKETTWAKRARAALEKSGLVFEEKS